MPSPTKTLAPTEPAPPGGSASGVIAYASLERNDWQIYIVNADGSGQRKVTVGVKGGYEPNWSPDGTKIVFQYGGIWIADIASGAISQMSLSVKGNNLENEYLVKPAWSPNGEWIAFLNESGTRGDIYLIRPDGTGLRRLTDSNDISRDGNLVWSADGKQLAYSAYRGGSIEIFVMDVEKALQGAPASQQLTDSLSPFRNLVTAWSPDGTRIAFSSDQDGNMEIYLMNPDGSKMVRLTNNPTSDTEPDWSPDGKQIVFSSDRDDNVDIYVLDVEEALQRAVEANVRRLTNRSGKDVGPVWSPATTASASLRTEPITALLKSWALKWKG
jgi:Tol biopolymer transport system component